MAHLCSPQVGRARPHRSARAFARNFLAPALPTCFTLRAGTPRPRKRTPLRARAPLIPAGQALRATAAPTRYGHAPSPLRLVLRSEYAVSFLPLSPLRAFTSPCGSGARFYLFIPSVRGGATLQLCACRSFFPPLRVLRCYALCVPSLRRGVALLPLAPARGSVSGGVLVIYRAFPPASRVCGRGALVPRSARVHFVWSCSPPLRCGCARPPHPPLPSRRARVARCAAPPFPPLWSARRRPCGLWAARGRAVAFHFVSLRFTLFLFSIPCGAALRSLRSPSFRSLRSPLRLALLLPRALRLRPPSLWLAASRRPPFGRGVFTGCAFGGGKAPFILLGSFFAAARRVRARLALRSVSARSLRSLALHKGIGLAPFCVRSLRSRMLVGASAPLNYLKCS